MATAFLTELKLQRQLATEQLEAARQDGDDFLVQVLEVRIDDLNELAAHHGTQS